MDGSKATLALYGIQDCNEQQTLVHDHNLCLMNNASVIDFIQLERITRKKRDNQLHLHLDDILRQKKWIDKDFDLVFVDNVLGRAFINKQGTVRFEAPLSTGLKSTIEKGICHWYGKRKEAYVLNHELAHIGTCLPFYGAFKENSLLVHFDGGASCSNFSAWHYIAGEIKLIEAHWDYKWLTTLFNANAFVFSVIKAKKNEQNSVPGKMMGLAGHGKYRKDLEIWLKENNFFEDIWKKPSMFILAANKAFNIGINCINERNSFIQDCIATLHELFVRATIDIFRGLESKTNANYLYYSGGSALNIVTNTRLVESGLFKDVYIPPCCEDSGLALGAAAFVEWHKHKKVELHSPYLNNFEIDKDSFSFSHSQVAELAKKLTNKEIVALFNGLGEAGPRALGQRSLLALANSTELSKKLSEGCKKREWYRPLAPIMLEKNAKYFTGLSNIHHLSRYMLLDFKILPERLKELKGAINKDGTARIQTIFKREENPFMWDLLSELDNKYEVKALINTSFNSQGEPIVHKLSDAIESAKKLGVSLISLHK